MPLSTEGDTGEVSITDEEGKVERMYIEKEVLLDDTHVGGTVVVARPLVEHHAAPGGLSQDPSLPTPPRAARSGDSSVLQP